MWLVITEDAGTARTMADGLDDRKQVRYVGGHAPAASFARDGQEGVVVAVGGPLLTPRLTGRGHPAERELEWVVRRRAAVAALRRRAPGVRALTLATAAGRAGELTALQAARVVSEAAPAAVRRARRASPARPLTAARWDPAPGHAALAAAAIDALWATLLAPVAVDGRPATLPTLALLASREPPTPALARSALAHAGLSPDGVAELLALGLTWTDRKLRVAPAGALLLESVRAQAPGLLDPACARRAEAVIGQVASGTINPEHALALGRALLRDVAPLPEVAAPDGYTEGRVLGRCPSCLRPMRPMRVADGRLRLACAGGEPESCGLAYPLPDTATAHPGGDPCSCGAPRLRVSLRGWWSAPRCAAGRDCGALA